METIFLVGVKVFKKKIPSERRKGKDEKEGCIYDNSHIGLIYLGHSHF
ncbi:TPA: hypothetical protein U1383_000453 [Streptococcus suis]|nr:hypothetical protein [Streptococcus suis]HEM5325496.1 hypothetical protein [Streptococcus suis]